MEVPGSKLPSGGFAFCYYYIQAHVFVVVSSQEQSSIRWFDVHFEAKSDSDSESDSKSNPDSDSGYDSEPHSDSDSDYDSDS